MEHQQYKLLQKELTETKKKAEEYLNGWKRTRADYINREKEIEKEKSEWVKFANMAIILQLLPILDNLKRGTQKNADKNTEEHREKFEAWIEGIKQIKNQLENLLKNLGLEEIKTEGEKFDPSLHESIGTEKSDKGEGLILKEIEAGYKLHGRVIKPAKVIVS
jgi:molecular chaperone GrpE